ncbi:murein hydrolase activator EnvC family protein [Lacibacter sediminis]|uniref:Peptidoglycan DD-metalloendopeptidase family protein n=1 Tax=Lacibacter sediminis TaxID=2760713 RepID=A0A7G5XI56_9BACT|nr:peptidoglycan DD-metalloendopeptidase family protein [Lacibacter sediminis]QNA45159.1 peptidoglycan DD-metalloendopeptidase family protein [Lacibacter sediminis]
MLKFLLVVCCTLLQVVLFAQDKNELERKRKQTLQEIDMLNRQYNDIKKNQKQSIGQLTLIQNKIRLRNEVINTINKQVRAINGDINTSYIEMRRLKKDLDTLKMTYAHNVVYAYKNRSSYDFLNFLFSATNFNDAIRRIAYMKAYRSYRAEQLEVINKTELMYRDKITQLTNARKEKSAVLTDQSKEMGELVKDKEEQASVVNNLKKREKEINKDIATKKKQAQQLQASITAVINREIAAAKKEAKEREDKLRKDKETADRIAKENAKTNPTTTTTAPAVTAPVVKKEEPKKTESYLEYNKEDLALGNSFESNKGKLPFPVDNGYVSINFGSYVIPGTNIKGNQDFITIASPSGTSVKACFDGEVRSVFDVGGNTAVIIQHGKYFTTYSNLSSTNVSKGQTVKTGQVIGRVGTNIDGDGELNFVLARENQMINPSPWLRGR